MNAMNKKEDWPEWWQSCSWVWRFCCCPPVLMKWKYSSLIRSRWRPCRVPTSIVKGETVEIRCELKREGHFSDARYTIRYFQPDGKGTLRMDDGMVLLPNDRYPLDRGSVQVILHF